MRAWNVVTTLLALSPPMWTAGTAATFEPNLGQVHSAVGALARTTKGHVYLTSDRFAVHIKGEVVVLSFDGARKGVQPVFEKPTGGTSNYFNGHDGNDWRTGIPHYAAVRFREVYPGVDVVYYSTPGGRLEYDLQLSPGANPGLIHLTSNRPLQLDSEGNLLTGGVRHARPRVTQNGREIESAYRVCGQRVDLRLGNYDLTQALIVDPVLDFSTYFGGPGGDEIRSVQLDASGAIYIGGISQTPATASLNPFQQPALVLGSAFVAKMSGDAKRVIYYSVITADGRSNAQDMVIDRQGSAVLAGYTAATNFPVRNAAQSENRSAGSNWFATKFTPDGRSFVYSTYYGGSSNSDILWKLAIDNNGNTILCGNSSARDFPAKNAAQSQVSNLFNAFRAVVVKMSPTGSVMFSTYWSGERNSSFYSVQTDATGNILLTGGTAANDYPVKNELREYSGTEAPTNNATLVKMSPEGSILTSTYLFPAASSFAQTVAIDHAGGVYVAGGGWGSYLKASPNAIQSTVEPESMAGYLMKLNPDLTKVLYSTYLGGRGLTQVRNLQVDATGAVFISGSTASPNFPLKGTLFNYRGGPFWGDTFLTRISPALNSLDFSTLIGGSRDDANLAMALDGKGGVYLAGMSWSSDLPVKNAFQSDHAGGTDGYIVRIIDDTPAVRSPLTPLPAVLTFRCSTGGPVPSRQVIEVTPANIPYAVSSSSWIRTAVTGGGGVEVSVDFTQLRPGVYSGTVTLTPITAGAPAAVSVTLTLLGPPPTLTSLDPSFIGFDSETTTVTVRGSGFTRETTVLLNGALLLPTPPVFVDEATLRIQIPESFTKGVQSFSVTAKNPNSDPSNGLTLSIGPAIVFTAEGIVSAATLEPGPVAPGMIVLINLKTAVSR